MKVLLIYPWYPYEVVTTFEEPVGILYLASVLIRAGHEVQVSDLTFHRMPDMLEEKVLWADVAGISSTTPLFGTATKILEYIRKIRPDMKTMIGGPHATANPSDALRPGFDVAAIGECEATIIELVEALGSGNSLEKVAGIVYREGEELRATERRPFIENLDDIPFPARQFIDYSKYRRFGIISMRGCPYRCIYCKPVEENLFGKKLRKRSLENVVNEIAYLINTYGKRPVSFKDDTLTVNKAEWFVRLGEEFRKRGLRIVWQCSSRVDTVDLQKLKAMKEAGCCQIFFGIESGSQRILDYYHKDIKVEQIIETFKLCRKVGIRACASIMMGAPFETREDLEKTYQMVKVIKPFNWHVHVTTPICGSYLYDWAVAEGRLNHQENYDAFAPTGNLYRLHLPMKLDQLTQDDIITYRDRINRYMKFRVLLNCAADPRIWMELFSSQGLRTIAFNFLRRHFSLFKKNKTQEKAGPRCNETE